MSPNTQDPHCGAVVHDVQFTSPGMGWFLYALTAAIFFTLYSVLIRRCLMNRGDAEGFAVLANVVIGLLSLLFTPLTEVYADIGLNEIVLILLGSALYAIQTNFFLRGRQLVEVSWAEVARQTSIVWAFLAGVVILGESVSLLKVLGAGLVVFGSVAAFWEKDHIEISRGLTYVLIGSAGVGLAGVVSRVLVEDQLSPTLYVASTSLLASLWLFVFLPDAKQRMVAELKQQRAGILQVGAAMSISLFLLMNAYQRQEASLVIPVFHSSLIFAVLAGILVMGERDKIGQKLLGVGIVFVGIVVLRSL